MQIAFYSSKPYEVDAFRRANARHGHTIDFLDMRLDARSAHLSVDAEAVCAFVNDDLSRATLDVLAELGIRSVALRCAGFNNVDLDAARKLGIAVVRVPSYSPESIAEHTLALILCLDRHIHQAHQRVREGNFSLEGLTAHGLSGSVVAIVGTGKIGQLVACILLAFGCDVVAYDPSPDPELVKNGVRYLPLGEAMAMSDIVSLNCPLTDETRHLIDEQAITAMKRGVMIVNTGRGALIDTPAVIDGLKTGQVGSLALDVYEEEGSLFFEDRSTQIITDDVYARLMTFPNVLLTAHQAFLSDPALDAIAETTLANLDDIKENRPCANSIL